MDLGVLAREGYAAGRAFGHVVETLVQHGSFTPTAMLRNAEGHHDLRRYAASSSDEADEMFTDTITSGIYGSAGLVKDGYLHLPRGRFDAVLISVAEQGGLPHQVVLAIPYEPKKLLRPFVFRRLQGMAPMSPEENEALLTGFWKGAEVDPKGAALYDRLFKDWD